MVESPKSRPFIGLEDRILKNSRQRPLFQKYLPFNSFQTAISTIRLQSLHLVSNIHNQNAISTIRLQSPHSPPLGVHIPQCLKRLAHCAILQSQQSDCNHSNQTAISAIRLQSQQSDHNLSNQTAISAIRIKHLATCLTPCWGPGCVYVS